jgi:hypothetical protein
VEIKILIHEYGVENIFFVKTNIFLKKPCAFFFIWKWVEDISFWNCPSDNDDYDL